MSNHTTSIQRPAAGVRRPGHRARAIALLLLAPLGGSRGARAEPKAKTFEATAYSLHGKTSAGTVARKGVVAADPDVLPPGSRIEVEGAGEHSGTYRVEDTGPAIQGRRIDIFEPSQQRAKTFGRKQVTVKVLEKGDAGK